MRAGSLVLALSLFFASSLQAQVKLAFFAGPQATSAHYTVAGTAQPSTFKYGVMAGVGAKVPFDTHLFFFPSVYYSLKGYKVTLNQPSYPPTELARNNNTTIHTIEIAPLFQVDLSGKPDHFFVRFGPAVDIVLSGREKFDTLGNGAPVERSMAFGFTEYGRYTASGNIHFGYETARGLMIYAHYEHGIGSLNNADNGPVILHRVVGITVGWYFRELR